MTINANYTDIDYKEAIDLLKDLSREDCIGEDMKVKIRNNIVTAQAIRDGKHLELPVADIECLIEFMDEVNDTEV